MFESYRSDKKYNVSITPAHSRILHVRVPQSVFQVLFGEIQAYKQGLPEDNLSEGCSDYRPDIVCQNHPRVNAETMEYRQLILNPIGY